VKGKHALKFCKPEAEGKQRVAGIAGRENWFGVVEFGERTSGQRETVRGREDWKRAKISVSLGLRGGGKPFYCRGVETESGETNRGGGEPSGNFHCRGGILSQWIKP